MDPRGLHSGQDPAPLLAHRPDPNLLIDTPAGRAAADHGPESRDLAVLVPPTRRAFRLSLILLDLAAQASAGAALESAGAPPLGKSPGEVRSKVTLDEIFERTRHAGFGFVIAFLTLAAIPLPGVSFPLGIAIAGAGVQMIAARERAWLPRRIGRISVPIRTIRWIGVKLERWTRIVAKLVRPRFGFAARGPFYTALGFAMLLHGIGLSLPLLIPGSNWVFAIPLLCYAIGLLEDDGLFLVAGHVLTAAEIVLAIAFWPVIVEGLTRLFQWIATIV